MHSSLLNSWPNKQGAQKCRVVGMSRPNHRSLEYSLCSQLAPRLAGANPHGEALHSGSFNQDDSRECGAIPGRTLDSRMGLFPALAVWSQP